MPAASGPAGASTEQDALALASRAGLSAHASPAVLAAHGASAATPAESAPASATGQATAADRLLGQVVDRLRTYQTQAGPVVESQLHTPELGTVQLVVAGRIGETIRAELVVADRQVADALSRSVDRAQSSGAGLVGMDVRIRVAQTDGRDAGTFDRGPGSQGTGRDTDQSLQHSAGGWPSGGGPAGAGAGHDGDGRPSSGAPLQAPVSITSTVPRAQPLPRLSSDGVVRLPFGGGSIDLRA